MEKKKVLFEHVNDIRDELARPDHDFLLDISQFVQKRQVLKFDIKGISVLKLM